MQKTISILLAAFAIITILSFSACSSTPPVDTAKYEKMTIQELKDELNKINPAPTTPEKKAILTVLGEEYLKKDKPDEHKKVDGTFEDAIDVYQDLPKLIDIKKEGKSKLIVALGKYIRRNIQIHFLNKNYPDCYRLAKKMYNIEQSNAGNVNLYIACGTPLAQAEFDKGNYEKAQSYLSEIISIQYDETALTLYGKSLLKLAEKAIAAKDYEKANGYLLLVPPIENNKEYTDAVTRVNKEFDNVLKSNK